MSRLLSLASALLTLLTAAAVLALVASPPPTTTTAPGNGDPAGIAPAAGDGDAAAGDGLAALLPRLARLAASPELAWVRGLAERVRPRGVELSDTRFTLSETPLGENLVVHLESLRLQPRAAGWDAPFVAHLADAPEVRFRGTARLRPTPAGTRVRVVVDHLTLGALARRSAPRHLALAQAAVTGVLETRLQAGGTTGPVHATFRLAEAGAIRAAGMAEPLALTTAEMAVTVPSAGDTLTIERLAVETPAFRLAARGEVGRDRVRIALAVDALDAARAPALWPEGVADGARDWITENITAGRIARLDASIDLDARALASPVLPADALYGEARVADAEIHYLRPMPPVTGADATARFDGERLTFTITGGEAAGVDVTGGEVVIRGYGHPTTVERLDVDLEGNGTVPAILALTDHEPLDLASGKGLPVASAAGAGDFRLQVGLPLLRDLGLDEVDLAFAGTFSDVRLPGMAAGRDLTEAEITLEATVDTVDAEGRGRVAGVPLDLGYRVTGDREVLRARGRLDASRLPALGAPALPLSGPVGLDATLTTSGGTERSTLRLDVTEADVEVASLALWKPAGIEGRIEATIVEQGDTVAVQDLVVRWPGAEIGGNARVEGGELVALTLDPLRLAGTDLGITGERDDGTLALRVEGPRLDLAPILHGERAESATADDGGMRGDPAALMPLRVELAVAELVAGGDASLTELRGEVEAADGAVRRLRLDAAVRPGDGRATVRLDPDGESGRLVVTSDDAGGLAAALGASDALRDGTLELVGTVTPGESGPRLDARFAARDFVISGAPSVVRVLAAAPPTADMADDDLAVAQFTSPLRYADGVLTLEDAVLVASNLAIRVRGDVHVGEDRLDLRGSLAPVQAVNRFIGNLPVIGGLLQGSSKAGAFAVSVTVEGPRDDPRVNVNPLSVVTPGVLQDLFAGVEVKPPRVPRGD